VLPATGLALNQASLAQIGDNARSGFSSCQTDFPRPLNLAKYQGDVNVSLYPAAGASHSLAARH